MAGQIFRKTALEKLSSPEQLDELMKITTPKGWVALIAFMIPVSYTHLTLPTN